MRLQCWLGAAVVAVIFSAPARAQADRFNGNWSVEVITQKGECDQAYRYAVIVEGGRFRYGGSENFNVSGQVQANGAVSASISRGNNRANVSGRLAGATGRGTWTTAGSRNCSGVWNAEKRG